MENEEVKQAAPNNFRIRNKVAEKFLIVVRTIKFLGYGAAIIAGLGIMSMDDDMFLHGLLAAGVMALVTWLSCLLWEAIAEGLQLLEDIKNK